MGSKSQPSTILATALSIQRFQRFATIGAFTYPVVAMLGLLCGVLPLTVFSCSMVAAIVVYAQHHQRHGDRKNWWWMRRGTVVEITDFDKLKEARLWLKNKHHEWHEIHPACFKFYKKSDAMHFKLVWG